MLLLAVSLVSTILPKSSMPPTKYRIVGYVGGNTDFYHIGVEKLTHINYAFGQVSPDGEIIFKNVNAPANLSQLQALKSRNPALKIIVSVGGWGADNFSDAAVSDASREKFAASAIDMIKRYALDGIDLDWEYPGQPGPGIKYRPEDKQNFTLLLKTIRQHLDALSDERKRTGIDRYTLTIASSDGEYFAHTEMDKLHVYLDWINIMAYDLYTIGSATTGHHTGLFRSANGPDLQRCTDAAVKQHLAAGIPSNKLVVGVAFYGRGWTGVNPINNGVYRPYAKFEKTHSYAELALDYIDKQGFRRFWDDSAKAPYLWNADSQTFISYDDPESLRAKANYVKANQLGGIMYWEHSLDPEEILLKTIYDNLKPSASR